MKKRILHHDSPNFENSNDDFKISPFHCRPDQAVLTPSHEVRDNSQPLRRIEADRRRVQGSL